MKVNSDKIDLQISGNKKAIANIEINSIESKDVYKLLQTEFFFKIASLNYF